MFQNEMTQNMNDQITRAIELQQTLTAAHQARTEQMLTRMGEQTTANLKFATDAWKIATEGMISTQKAMVAAFQPAQA